VHASSFHFPGRGSEFGLFYEAATGEANDLEVAGSAGTATITDQGAAITVPAACSQANNHEAVCPSINFVSIRLGDLNDTAVATQTALIGGIEILGEGGEDDLSACPLCAAELRGGSGGDTLTGGDQRRHEELLRLSGGAGNDTIIGGPRRDQIYDGKGADTIVGGGRRDTFHIGSGDDQVDGGAGRDVIRYPLFLRGGAVVDLGAGTSIGAGTKHLVDVEDVRGTNFDDKLYGNWKGNGLDGEGGDDLLVGRGGNDFLEPDRPFFNRFFGDDRCFAGRGNDQLRDDNRGVDLLVGNAGDDLLAGGPGEDVMQGRLGNDLLFARDGYRDVVRGGRGSDKARIDLSLDVTAGIETFF
jgi:Ca2+-binding RTX toxin-like protein